MNTRTEKDIQNVFVVGAGGIGTKLVQQILRYDTMDSQHGHERRIIGIADSNKFIVKPNGLFTRSFGKQEPEQIETQDLKQILKYGDGYLDYDKIINSVKDEIGGKVVFVDVTASGLLMTEFHKLIIKKRVHSIVTANKLPLVDDIESFKHLTRNDHKYRYNTSVMAGGGAVDYLKDAHCIGETIESIEGTFSGTLAYICSELEKGEKFSEIVKNARELGYTEPHPINDLNGEDVKRKLLILLRSAGLEIELDNIKLTGFINPSKYENMNVEVFLEEIKQEDDAMKALVEGNLSKGYVPRYIASYYELGGEMIANVSLQFVPKESPLGNLSGTANKIIVHTSQRAPLGQTPFIIETAGAGQVKTAASVRADLCKIL